MGMFDDLLPSGDKVSSKKLSDLVVEGSGGKKGMFDDLIPQSKELELRKSYLNDMLKAGDPGYSQRLKDSATLGLMRPLGGLMRGVSGVFDPNSTFGERYRAGVGAEEDYANRAVENTNPYLGFATDVAGGLGSSGVGKAAAAGREALGSIIARGAAQGGVEGAARNSEDVGSAVGGAATGAALGGTVAGAIGGAAKALPGVRGAEEAARKANQGLTPDELKAAAKPLFQSLDMGGISYAQLQTKQLAKGIDDLIATNQYNKIAHGKISGFVDELAQKAQQPQGMGFNELHNLRSALAKEARGADEGTRTAASKMIEKIDDLVLNNQPKGSLNPQNIDVAKTYSKARELWKAASVADDVGYLARKADRKIASKAGSNPDEINRAAFRPLVEKLDKPGAYQGAYSDEQRKMLARIVEGDTRQNLLRGTGAVANSPITKALIGLGGGALGLHGGGLMGGILGGGAGRLGSEAGGLLTRGLNRAAATRGAANIDALLRDITQSQAKPIPPEALRVLLAKQAAQRAGGAYAGSFTGSAQPQERLRVTRDAQ